MDSVKADSLILYARRLLANDSDLLSEFLVDQGRAVGTAVTAMARDAGGGSDIEDGPEKSLADAIELLETLLPPLETKIDLSADDQHEWEETVADFVLRGTQRPQEEESAMLYQASRGWGPAFNVGMQEGLLPLLAYTLRVLRVWLTTKFVDEHGAAQAEDRVRRDFVDYLLELHLSEEPATEAYPDEVDWWAGLCKVLEGVLSDESACKDLGEEATQTAMYAMDCLTAFLTDPQVQVQARGAGGVVGGVQGLEDEYMPLSDDDVGALGDYDEGPPSPKGGVIRPTTKPHIMARNTVQQQVHPMYDPAMAQRQGPRVRGLTGEFVPQRPTQGGIRPAGGPDAALLARAQAADRARVQAQANPPPLEASEVEVVVEDEDEATEDVEGVVQGVQGEGVEDAPLQEESESVSGSDA